MKTKKFYILLTVILLSTQLFAAHTTFKEQTCRLKRTENSKAKGRPNPLNRERKPALPTAPQDAPIGDALILVLSLALIYGVYKKSMRNTKSI
jgi:hypothetical protein